MDRCNFVIFPSCAEGQPGSVIECMHQGLIPVVSRESNIDTDDYGITLSECSIEEISRVVSDLTKCPPERCEEMSLKTRKTSVNDFSADAFSKNLENAIKCILSTKRTS